MAQLQAHYYQTRAGKMSLVCAPLTRPARPVVVFLHGALRDTEMLIPWVELLADTADVVMVDLPGHGRSQLAASMSVESMAGAVLEMLRTALPSRAILLVGESLGGTIALAIGGGVEPAWVRAVLALDPPLATGKLWIVTEAFREVMKAAPDNALVPALGRDAFGILDDEVRDIVYYPLLDRLRVPAVIATGDVPLMPRRETDEVPCVFDDADRAVVEGRYAGRVTVQQISGSGHLLLVEARAQCLALIKALVAKYFV